jgi:hypothetical protein
MPLTFVNDLLLNPESIDFVDFNHSIGGDRHIQLQISTSTGTKVWFWRFEQKLANQLLALLPTQPSPEPNGNGRKRTSKAGSPATKP